MARKTLVVIGNGMVGQKLLEVMVDLGDTHPQPAANWDVVTFCEEPRPAYDRVALSSFFAGTSEEELSLVPEGFFQHPSLTVHMGDQATRIDRRAKTVTSAAGITVAYDALVFATGSYPFVPPIPGNDAQGVFVYRTIEDLEAIRAYAQDRATGAVVGGGLLGLEAANALKSLGLVTHVVEFAPRLMPVQVDEGGGRVLRQWIEELGVSIHTDIQTNEIVCDDHGKVVKMSFADGAELVTDLVVFSAGIRPRDDLARECGLEIGERGGIVVDDTLATSDPDIYAIGECALSGGRIYGLVAPGYQMARVVADRLMGGDARFTGADMSTKLKLMGVDVASFGDAHAMSEGAQPITFSDPVAKVYKKLVLDSGGSRVLGGVFVGDAATYGVLVQMMQNDVPVPERPHELILPTSSGAGGVVTGMSVTKLPDAAQICSCHNVAKGAICSAIREGDLGDVAGVKACTKAGTGCGSCVTLVTELLYDEMRKAGREVKPVLCEHFDFTRQELFDIVRVRQIMSFSELIGTHGRGRGCEVCKPAVASMLASMANGYILDGEQAALQDTNDHFLANLQRDGTYSVVPRVPGGEITPEKLIVLGEVAREFGLYTKITGGQRVDLFGARVDELPKIWGRLLEAGFESGHAYGKALRTVKSCVGTTWCRYGVQDSVSLAVELELRYRGLRSPHKLKSAVSGCARECAEAQSKDFGVIATERGWNLYVCGNGGMKPQHAVLLAEDQDDEMLIRLIDRFLMFYIRTADRLERTAPWFNKLDGGIEYLRSVLIEDSLGICNELEAEMARHIENYECEWKATVRDPQKMARFVHFVNAPEEPDPNVVFVKMRDQVRPAFSGEKPDPELVNT